ENCPDVRNTKIVDVVAALKDYGVKVTIFDPWANPEEVKHEYKLDSVTDIEQIRKSAPETKSNGTKLNSQNGYDTIVIGVAHKEFLSLDLDSLKKEKAVVYDVKGIIGRKADSKL